MKIKLSNIMSLFFLAISLVFVNCKQNSKDANAETLFVNLKTKSNPLSTVSIPFSFLDTIPEFYADEIKTDSTFIGYIDFISPNELELFINKNKSSNEQIGKIKSRLYCVTGIENGVQFLSVDKNQNNTFKDDEKILFSTKLTYETKTRVDSIFRVHRFIVSKLRNGKHYKDEVFVKFFPNANYLIYRKIDDKIIFKQRLQLIAEFSDYFSGNFSVSNINYEVTATKDFRGSENEFLFAQANHSFPKELHDRFLIKDTIKINKEYFIIDSLSLDTPGLFLRPIITDDVLFGFRVGDQMKNIEIETLNEKFVMVKDLFQNQEFLLLDFWGTWCAPCKELTPDLINLNRKYKSNLGLVSLAYQEDVTPVKEYITTNKMNWTHGILRGKPKTRNPKQEIIRNLRVVAFPTFILLDRNLNILYRTSGKGTSFQSLVKFIDNQFKKD